MNAAAIALGLGVAISAPAHAQPQAPTSTTPTTKAPTPNPPKASQPPATSAPSRASTASSAAAPATPVSPDASVPLTHGLFDPVWVYRPSGAVQRFVMLMSGQDGITADDRQRAQAMAAAGAMVALVDVARFYARLEAEGGRCTFANGAFENLSRHLQAYDRLPTYLTPMLVGRGAGGTLAYAMLAQAAPGTFASALSLGFCPQLPFKLPMCDANALRSLPQAAAAAAPAATASAATAAVASTTSQPAVKSEAKTRASASKSATPAPAAPTRPAGSTLLPGGKLPAPWVVVGSAADSACPVATAQAFVEQTPGGQWQALPGGAGGGVGDAQANAQASVPANVETRVQTNEQTNAQRATAFQQTFAQLAARSVVQQLPPPPASLSDLPIIEVPVAAPPNANPMPMAVLLSGDGGWAGIDKDLGAEFAKRGVPVAGFDSLRYFWTARTPEGVAADLDRLIRYYLARWGRSEVLLIGYSQGADVLPFALNRLPAATRSRVRLTALLGPGQKASFEFHVTNWIGPSGDRPIAPEAMRLSAAEVLCVYGSEERNSLCPQLAPKHAKPLMLKGDHHFDGDYGKLARLILEAMPPR